MDIIKGIIFSSFVATIVMAILVFFGLDIDTLFSIASIVVSIKFLESILVGVAYAMIGFISPTIMLFFNTFL